MISVKPSLHWFALVVAILCVGFNLKGWFNTRRLHSTIDYNSPESERMVERWGLRGDRGRRGLTLPRLGGQVGFAAMPSPRRLACSRLRVPKNDSGRVDAPICQKCETPQGRSCQAAVAVFLRSVSIRWAQAVVSL